MGTSGTIIYTLPPAVDPEGGPVTCTVMSIPAFATMSPGCGVLTMNPTTSFGGAYAVIL